MHKLIRKFAHFAVYFVLGFLSFNAFRDNTPQRWNLRWSVYSVILIILLALIDEFHQSFIPSRTPLLSDVVIDSAGGIFSQITIVLRQNVQKYQGK